LELLWRIFANNILPTFVVMGAGVVLDRQLHVDRKHLSRMAIYVLTPCLVFSLIANSTVDAGEFGLMIAFALSITLLMSLLGLLVGRLLGWDGKRTDALILSIAFLNAGNFGLSVVLFAYGDPGLELASVFFVASSLATYTVAAFFANRSNGGSLRALGKVLRLPAPYAFALALIVRALGWPIPEVIEKPVALIARAAVPVLLMMLGMQLSQTRMGKRVKDVAVGVFLRLVVGALVALGLAPLFGLTGLARQVAIVEASMPTAVSSALVAIEFDADAEFVSSVILVSTLLSAISLTVLISLLGG
jgi:predicted permease